MSNYRTAKKALADKIDVPAEYIVDETVSKHRV